MGDLDAAATMAELEALLRKAREGGDFDHADHGPLIYNLALLYFLHRRFLQADELLRPVSVQPPVDLVTYYRETMVVMDLGWVDLTLEYSTILLGSS